MCCDSNFKKKKFKIHAAMFYLNSRSKSLKVNLNIAKNQCFTINYRKDKKSLVKKIRNAKLKEA